MRLCCDWGIRSVCAVKGCVRQNYRVCVFGLDVIFYSFTIYVGGTCDEFDLYFKQ